MSNVHGMPHEIFRSIVPCSQIAYELNQLKHEASLIEPKSVLEIGSQHGGTLLEWMKLATGGLVVSVDAGPQTWNPPQNFDNSIWFGWAKEHGVTLHALTANSHDQQTLDKVKEISPRYDFIFIDGDHTYEGAKQDFEMYFPLLSKGGIMAFHDLITPGFSPHIQVGKLWLEIQEQGYKTLEIHAGASWGGIGVVYL